MPSKIKCIPLRGVHQTGLPLLRCGALHSCCREAACLASAPTHLGQTWAAVPAVLQYDDWGNPIGGGYGLDPVTKACRRVSAVCLFTLGVPACDALLQYMPSPAV